MSLRIGIVGCGAVSAYLHAPAIAATPGLEVCAAVDTDIDNARALAQDYGEAEAATSLAGLDTSLDAIVLATPPHVRLPMIRQAMQQGLHVMVEKPLANTYRECIEIADVAEHERRVLAVCHQYRFWPNRNRIKAMLAEDDPDWPDKVRVSLGNPYSWQSNSGYTVRREMSSGGVLINAGIHPLDTLIDWFGEPSEIDYEDDAFDGLESNARIRMQYRQGLEVELRLSRTCRLSNTFHLEWAERAIEFSNSDPVSYRLSAKVGEPETVHVADRALDFIACAADLYRDFCEAIEQGNKPQVDALEAARVVQLIEQCYLMKRSRVKPEICPLPGHTW
jgi:predicted dehydrogenase